MEQTKKKLTIRIVCVVCIAVVVLGGIGLCIALLGHGNSVSASTILSSASDKLWEMSQNVAKNATTSDASGSVSANVNVPGWEDEGIAGYISESSYPAGYTYAMEFLTRNATKENGFANGFEYDKVYSGKATFYAGFQIEGIVYFTANKTKEGADFFLDFKTNYSGQDIMMCVSFSVEYDTKNETATKLKVNCVTHPYIIEIWSTEFDFTNNSFKMFRAHNEIDSTFDKDTCSQIVDDYNNGQLTFDKVINYDWYNANIVTGNIASNTNNIICDAYEYYKGDSHEVNYDIVAACYNSIYNELKGFKLRTEQDFVDTKDAVWVNYSQYAADYGENKANVYVSRGNGYINYYYSFLEYDELVKHLTKVKETIESDEQANSACKNIINSALGYITNQGVSKYTGELGTYNGIESSLYLGATSEYENGVWKFTGYYEITSGDYKITFKVLNGETFEIHYGNENI